MTRIEYDKLPRRCDAIDASFTYEGGAHPQRNKNPNPWFQGSRLHANDGVPARA